MLDKASIKQMKAQVQEDKQWRQGYHMMPQTGWLNDPNGLAYFQDTYHIYHQYEPYKATGGATHWGHKTSEDLVHFQEEVIFLSPDQPFDQDGVYSGSAIEVDGQLHFFYTGNVKKPGHYDYIYSGREQNVVHVVSPDGFEIQSREVVIAHEDFPPGYSDHIRDPNVFSQNDKFYMLLGARTDDNKGAIILYESQDLDNWTFLGDFLAGDEDQGFMWECPDYSDHGEHSVLIFSPQGVIGDHFSFQNPYSAGYLIGNVDWDMGRFLPTEDFQELDYGFDFYAPQTFKDAKGRHILIGWMGMPDIEPEYTNPTISYGWQHCLALPREIEVKNHKLYQKPIEEYQVLRGDAVNLETDKSYETSALYELNIAGENLQVLQLELSQDSQLTYDGEILTLRHGVSGFGRKKRQVKIPAINRIQVLGDYSSLEIFINDGEYVLTTRIYPTRSDLSIRIEADQEVKATYWPLSET